jgi:hypothetical protein
MTRADPLHLETSPARAAYLPHRGARAHLLGGAWLLLTWSALWGAFVLGLRVGG